MSFHDASLVRQPLPSSTGCLGWVMGTRKCSKESTKERKKCGNGGQLHTTTDVQNVALLPKSMTFPWHNMVLNMKAGLTLDRILGRATGFLFISIFNTIGTLQRLNGTKFTMS